MLEKPDFDSSYFHISEVSDHFLWLHIYSEDVC